jgi:hypothetical protein
MTLRSALAQTQPELVTALIKTGHVWCGVKANGDKGSFSYGSFFPNDYNIIFHRGQEWDAWSGGGLRLATTNWIDSADSLHSVAIYGPTNEFQVNGQVRGRSDKNYVRYDFPDQTIDFTAVDLPIFGICGCQ